MIAVGRCRAVCRWRERRLCGEKRFTAAGNGDKARLRELLEVVARWRTVGGVTISNSSSDFSLLSFTRVGVFGGGDRLLDRAVEEGFTSHICNVSGVRVSSETSRL